MRIDTTEALQCIWADNVSELRHWAVRRLPNGAETEDFLQDLFLKALHQGERFYVLENPRAWLFEVARNALADRWRKARDTVELSDDLAADSNELATVDQLTVCLPRVLAELTEEDRDALTLCDLQGMPQADFAQLRHLSLSGAKSRVQRARQHLRTRMVLVCQVQMNPAGQVNDFAPRQPPLV